MKMVLAKHQNRAEVTIWGTGTPVREWLHVDDGAEAMIRGLSAPSTLEPINVGIAKGISILEMAKLIKVCVGYEGELILDPSMPDGAPHKTVDGSRGAEILGWKPSRSFKQGVQDTVSWYLKHGNH
jgi:GDP-L-fucose synthase